MQSEKKEPGDIREKRRRVPLTERLHDALDVPLTCATNVSYVELFGGRQAVVGGCESVVLYTEEEVVLRVRDGYIRLLGGHMEMQSLIGDRITVRGEIHTVSVQKTAEAGKV